MQEKPEFASASGLDAFPLCDSSQEECDFFMQHVLSPSLDCCLQELPEDYAYDCGLPLLAEDPLCKIDLPPVPMLDAFDSDSFHTPDGLSDLASAPKTCKYTDQRPLFSESTGENGVMYSPIMPSVAGTPQKPRRESRRSTKKTVFKITYVHRPRCPHECDSTKTKDHTHELQTQPEDKMETQVLSISHCCNKGSDSRFTSWTNKTSCEGYNYYKDNSSFYGPGKGVHKEPLCFFYKGKRSRFHITKTEQNVENNNKLRSETMIKKTLPIVKNPVFRVTRRKHL